MWSHFEQLSIPCLLCSNFYFFLHLQMLYYAIVLSLGGILDTTRFSGFRFFGHSDSTFLYNLRLISNPDPSVANSADDSPNILITRKINFDYDITFLTILCIDSTDSISSFCCIVHLSVLQLNLMPACNKCCLSPHSLLPKDCAILLF